MHEIDNALCRGYADALAGDDWLTESQRRLLELIDGDVNVVRGRDVRALTVERGRFERSLTTLRHELAELRLEHDHLRSRSLASSS